jgi:hypothetical protein
MSQVWLITGSAHGVFTKAVLAGFNVMVGRW